MKLTGLVFFFIFTLGASSFALTDIRCPISEWKVKIQCKDPGAILQLDSHTGTYQLVDQENQLKTLPNAMICKYQASSWSTQYEIHTSSDVKKETATDKSALVKIFHEINKHKRIFDINSMDGGYDPYLTLTYPLDGKHSFGRYILGFLFTGIDYFSTDTDMRIFPFQQTRNPAVQVAANLQSEILEELLAPNPNNGQTMEVSNDTNKKADDYLTGSLCNIEFLAMK